MCCKNECLKLCPGRVLQGHNSNAHLVPPTPPCSPFLSTLMTVLGKQNSEEHYGFMLIFQVSFLLERIPKPSLQKVHPEAPWYLLGFFFAGIPFPLNEALGVNSSTPAPKLPLPQGFYERQNSFRKTTMTRTKWLSSLMDSI